MAGSRFHFHVTLALLLPVPALAETLAWGQVDLKAGAVHFGNLTGEAVNIVDRNPESLDVAGRLGADWGALGAQLDLNYGNFSNNSDAEHHHDWGQQAAVRLTYDLSSAFSLGAVYGRGKSQPVADPGADLDFQAVEGAFATGSWQIGLQLGKFDAVDSVGTNAFHNGTFQRVSVIYSLGATSALKADLGLFDGKQDAFPDPVANMEGVTLSVEYSRQIGEAPLAWSAGIETGHFQKDGLEASDMDQTRAMIGLTAWFGDGDFGSAKQRGIFSQPDFSYLVDTGNLMD